MSGGRNSVGPHSTPPMMRKQSRALQRLQRFSRPETGLWKVRDSGRSVGNAEVTFNARWHIPRNLCVESCRHSTAKPITPFLFRTATAKVPTSQASKNGSGFEVRESGEASNITFDYRIVAELRGFESVPSKT